MTERRIKLWIKAAAVRALKTMAQTAAATIGTTAMTMGEVNWMFVASASALAGCMSLLTSVAGLPEVELEMEAEGKHFADDDTDVMEG